MNKYTPELIEEYAKAAEGFNEPTIGRMLCDYATLLRERESPKAAVTDEMVERACEAFEGPYHWEFQTDLVKTNTRAAMRQSLEAVALQEWT